MPGPSPENPDPETVTVSPSTLRLVVLDADVAGEAATAGAAPNVAAAAATTVASNALLNVCICLLPGRRRTRGTAVVHPVFRGAYG